MTSNAPNIPEAGSSNSENPVTESPPKYYPQFSAATEMILKRIHSGAGSSNLSSFSSMTGSDPPPGYEDMRRSVLMGMKTSLNMEIPSTAAGSSGGRKGGSGKGSASGKGRGSPNLAPKGRSTPSNTPGSGKGKGAAKSKFRSGAGGKRKRARDSSESEESESDVMSKLGGSDSDSDASGSITEMPKITQSGRQIVKPAQYVPGSYEAPAKRRAPTKRTQEQALCKRCGRGHSPQNNMIVFCDGCNLGWHQSCHDPPIVEDVVKDEATPWFCNDCSRKRSKKSGSEESRGVSWQGRSSEEKRGYLNSLPQQQLVSLLMQATVLFPHIPIFPATNPQSHGPAPTRSQSATTSRNSQQPFPPSATTSTGLFARTDANPNAPMNFIRKIQAGQTPPANSQPQFTHASSAPPTLNIQQVVEESRESTPASPPYPKPGMGLMAKLGPDEDDIEWLVDEGDYEAFSHTVFNENGIVGEENGVVMNGGLM